MLIRFQGTRDRDSLGDKAFQALRVQVGCLVARVTATCVDIDIEAARGRVLNFFERTVPVLELNIATLRRSCPGFGRPGTFSQLYGLYCSILEIS
jgi:hypothetical protein